jgi:hypothetical protein
MSGRMAMHPGVANSEDAEAHGHAFLPTQEI